MNEIEKQQIVWRKFKKMVDNKKGYQPYVVTPESELDRDLYLDSLDRFELQQDCEDLFKVRIPHHEWEPIGHGKATAQEVVNYISSHPELRL